MQTNPYLSSKFLMHNKITGNDNISCTLKGGLFIIAKNVT